MLDSLNEVAVLVLAAINIIGFVTVGVDKYKAKYKLWRIPERTFFVITILGGFPGVYSALFVFRHKTQRWYFTIGMPFIFLIQLFLFYWLKFK